VIGCHVGAASGQGVGALCRWFGFSGEGSNRRWAIASSHGVVHSVVTNMRARENLAIGDQRLEFKGGDAWQHLMDQMLARVVWSPRPARLVTA
jgi:hypothetical protein